MALTRQTGSTFCSISVFEARALDLPVANETALEWHNIVATSFKATVKRRATLTTTHGVSVAAATVALVDADANAFAGVHYVVMPPGMIGSVLLISNTAATLQACEPAATAVVGSLAIDWASPRFTDPEARVETPQGRWATVGATSREYTFAADGTYRFHSEATEPGRDHVSDETGAYTVVGNQLTLTPKKATAAVVELGVTKVTPPVLLAKTTYTWGKRYVVETNEWQLVLTPPPKTTPSRDGKLPANAAAYPYSDQAKPAWKFASQPGV
ncbi:MAG: hypothetical protein NT062_01215 [Proteobacteria bacterium]|nr:hypothetical protein [Pseudomonadota bacterium]